MRAARAASAARAVPPTVGYTDTPTPEVHLLSNGRYHVALSNAGGGYSRWRDLAVTRWHEDPTRDCWGMFGYLRDVAPEIEPGGFTPARGDNACWSIGHQPTLAQATSYEAIFSQGRAELRRVDHELEAQRSDPACAP